MDRRTERERVKVQGRRKREWLRPSADVPRIMPTELHGWQGVGSVLVAVAALVDRRGWRAGKSRKIN